MIRGNLGEADQRAVEHALYKGSKRITQINEYTRDQVRRLVGEAIDQGMSAREAGEYIENWKGWDEYRAERIARTEMMDSYNSAAIDTYKEYGVQLVEAVDGDDDEECAARNGQVFSVAEAANIQDHPNGTLDWIPIAPDSTVGRTASATASTVAPTVAPTSGRAAVTRNAVRFTHEYDGARAYYEAWAPKDVAPRAVQAFERYGGQGFIDLNKVLRADGVFSEEQVARWTDEAVEMSKAMKPLSDDVVVWRDVGYKAFGAAHGDEAALRAALRQGYSFIDDGFLSTSVVQEAEFGGIVNIELAVPKGTRAMWMERYTHIEDEMELLLDRGQNIVIDSVTEEPYRVGNKMMTKFRVKAHIE